MKIKFTNPDPRDFPTLGLSGVESGKTVDLPVDTARDLVRQGHAVHVVPKKRKPASKPAPKTATPAANTEE